MFQGLLPRLLLGLMLAAALIFVLQLSVGSEPGTNAPASPLTQGGPAGGGPSGAPVDADGRAVLDTLRGEALLVYLARRPGSLPREAAPVLAIGPGGAISLTVPPPLRQRPGPEIWPKIGILLPQARLVRLSAAERASLLRIWSVVAGEGWLRERQIVATDLDYRPEELAPLLKRQQRWR
ncbi:MAG: hypothetical protein ACYST0_02485 [Planctomycetota bacterium]|jgi:hypothetical protein